MRECGNCGRVTADDHETTCLVCGHITQERKVFKSKRKLPDEKVAAVDEQVIEPR